MNHVCLWVFKIKIQPCSRINMLVHLWFLGKTYRTLFTVVTMLLLWLTVSVSVSLGVETELFVQGADQTAHADDQWQEERAPDVQPHVHRGQRTTQHTAPEFLRSHEVLLRWSPVTLAAVSQCSMGNYDSFTKCSFCEDIMICRSYW